MTTDRLARILLRVVGSDHGAPTPDRLCHVAAELGGVTGAGVMLAADGIPQASLVTTGGGVAHLIEELLYTLGEGPCIDAHRTGTVIAEPDLAAPGPPRWPAFTPKVLDAGARAVFGFPVRIGAAGLGALNLYRDQPGPLGDDQEADMVVMADVIARTVLALQAQAGPGLIAAELDSDIHSAVHQAGGMVSIQLDVAVAEALVRLRARAFRADRTLSEIAEDVIARRLRFDEPDQR